MRNFDDALNYLKWLCTFGVKEGLERIHKITSLLGQPQNFYRTIHIAGTNGKGSICAMLAEILHAQGLHVGLFTSPHLESYCERIKVDGVDISETDFAEMIFKVKDCGIEATHFEVLTAAAFEYFRERKVDVAVIEVGLGGTMDSTNIITPELSVITTIGLDHENILGDLENIALNKAGIIKSKVPIITGAKGKSLEIIKRVATEKKSPLHIVDKLADINVNLSGSYQKFNAAIAIRAAEIFGAESSAIEIGLSRVKWAGRFEIVKTSSGVAIIDGAHNPDGAKALRHALDESFPRGRRIWLFGALRDKNFREMIKILFRAEDFVIVSPPISERAATADELCNEIRELGISCAIEENNFSAVERLMNSDADVKVIAGSLYLIGAVRRAIINEQY